MTTLASPLSLPRAARLPNRLAKAAMSERLAAWAGPKKMPSAMPSAQNAVLSWVSRMAMPVAISPTSAMAMVRLAPIQSSIQAKPKAPRPAVRLSAMPNQMTSSTVMPNSPAA